MTQRGYGSTAAVIVLGLVALAISAMLEAELVRTLLQGP